MKNSLGAIELIELGSKQTASKGQRPFMAGPAPRLGQLGDIAGFLGDVLSTAIGVVADIVSVPLTLIYQGVDWVFTNIASVLSEVPILGELVAQVLLIANSVVKFALSLPGLILGELEKAFAGLSKAFEGAFTEDQQAEKLLSAKEQIIGNAPEPIRKSVATMIEKTPTGQKAPTAPASRASDVETVLTWGIPAAAAATVAIALLA